MLRKLALPGQGPEHQAISKSSTLPFASDRGARTVTFSCGRVACPSVLCLFPSLTMSSNIRSISSPRTGEARESFWLCALIELSSLQTSSMSDRIDKASKRRVSVSGSIRIVIRIVVPGFPMLERVVDQPTGDEGSRQTRDACASAERLQRASASYNIHTVQYIPLGISVYFPSVLRPSFTCCTASVHGRKITEPVVFILDVSALYLHSHHDI